MLEDGSRGLVVKSGHGFYTVELDHNAGRILKRVAELRLEREALGLPSGELHAAHCTVLLCCIFILVASLLVPHLHNGYWKGSNWRREGWGWGRGWGRGYLVS